LGNPKRQFATGGRQHIAKVGKDALGRFGAQIPDPMEFTGCTGFDWAMADFWY
jgi:hypothetical protein